MTDPKPGNPNVKDQYAAQVAADLERNAKEQEEIGTELETLQNKLRALQDDQAILVSMQQALGTKEGAAVTPDKAQRRKSAPAAASAKSSAPKQGKQPRAAKTTSGKTTTSKATSGKAASDKATSPSARPARKASASAQPTLVTLVQEYLKQQTEPRSAAELADALTAAHPDRTFKKPVVRTTVEGLVARGLAQRSKQGSSVFYSTPEQAKSPEPAAE
ncbi:hypothetical protein [Streptomyces sp. NPDC016845]|uniref:hypothetical protein n=1 Tax=Streptomyces sp. NPDC016845 TaxID=3364972 RepID=UPI0037978326